MWTIIAIVAIIIALGAIVGLRNWKKLALVARAQASEATNAAVEAKSVAVLQQSIEDDAAQIDRDSDVIAKYQGSLNGITRQIDDLTNKIANDRGLQDAAADELAELIRAGKQDSDEYRQLETEFTALQTSLEGDEALLTQLKSQYESDRKFLDEALKRHDDARARIKASRAEADRLKVTLQLSATAARMSEDRSRLAGIGNGGSATAAARETVLKQIDQNKARAEIGNRTMGADDLRARLQDKARANKASGALQEALAKRGVGQASQAPASSNGA